MKKPLWAELVSLSALIFLIIGCAVEEETPPPPKPSVTVTVTETNEKSSIRVHYEHHQNGSAWVDFSSADEVGAYREQLEFAVVKLKEAEEKMNVDTVPKETEKENSGTKN